MRSLIPTSLVCSPQWRPTFGAASVRTNQSAPRWACCACGCQLFCGVRHSRAISLCAARNLTENIDTSAASTASEDADSAAGGGTGIREGRRLGPLKRHGNEPPRSTPARWVELTLVGIGIAARFHDVERAVGRKSRTAIVDRPVRAIRCGTMQLRCLAVLKTLESSEACNG